MTAAATPAGTQVAERPPSEYEKFRAYLTTNQMLEQLSPMVGGEVQAKMFVRVVLNAIQKTPALLDADRKSLLLAAMSAARDKLMPDGKEAVLNIYSSKHKIGGRDVWLPTVQYLPMLAGIVKKLYESGEVTLVDGVAVYQADDFDYARGDAPFIHHKPNLTAEPGPLIAAYVVIKLKSGEKKLEVIARRDVDKIRQASAAPNSPAWVQWFDQMAIKAVIKRVYKQIPSSVEIDQVIAADNDALGFDDFAGAGVDIGAPTAVDKINAEVTGAGKKEAQAAITHEKANTVPPMKVDQGEPVQVETKKAAAASTIDPDKQAQADRVNERAGIVTSKPVLDLEPLLSFEAVAAKINATKTVDELTEARDLIRSVKDIAHREALGAHANKHEKTLTADDAK